jgi:hypothetical protein
MFSDDLRIPIISTSLGRLHQLFRLSKGDTLHLGTSANSAQGSRAMSA